MVSNSGAVEGVASPWLLRTSDGASDNRSSGGKRERQWGANVREDKRERRGEARILWLTAPDDACGVNAPSKEIDGSDMYVSFDRTVELH
jgi:hypothetical protein